MKVDVLNGDRIRKFYHVKSSKPFEDVKNDGVHYIKIRRNEAL